MAGKGYSEGGLGRHVLGSNYFHYVRGAWAAMRSTPATSTTPRPSKTGGAEHARRLLLPVGPRAAGDFTLNREL